VLNGGAELLPIVHLHALVFTAWLAVFVTQNILVLRGRTDVHRRLGPWAVALAGVMLLLGTATAVAVAREGHRGIPGVEFPDPGGFLLLNVAAVVIFTVLVFAGWYYRRSSQAHKRLMLMSVTAALVGPGASRLPFATGNPGAIAAIVLAFLLAGPAYDLVTRRRIHPAYLWGIALAIFGLPPVVLALSATAAWRSTAAALLQ
jgi:hypothetical protein